MKKIRIPPFNLLKPLRYSRDLICSFPSPWDSLFHQKTAIVMAMKRTNVIGASLPLSLSLSLGYPLPTIFLFSSLPLTYWPVYINTQISYSFILIISYCHFLVIFPTILSITLLSKYIVMESDIGLCNLLLTYSGYFTSVG